MRNENNKKGNVMNNIVVRVEKSGNRFNAWDADGVKYTSQITTGVRKPSITIWLWNKESTSLVRLIGGQFRCLSMKRY